MPAYKDKKSGLWFCKFYYEDHEGKNKQKFKRGFHTKKEAQNYEVEYKSKLKSVLHYKFDEFVTLFINDKKNRWKVTTENTYQNKIEHWILPYFKDKYIEDITVKDIRNWQNMMINKGLADSTLRKNHQILSSIFNYAVKFYDLEKNPCLVAGSIGSYKRTEMNFWTLDEFNEFIQYVDDEEFSLAFKTLYYTGLRIGELIALTPSDFDFSVPKLTVNKNLQTVKGVDYYLDPKTEKSHREVVLPQALANELETYINSIHGLNNNQRIFYRNKSSYGNKLRKICDKYDLKKIRIHDLRHSHVSLLIEMGFSPVLIAERLGHDNVDTTLNIYSHLFPNKQKEVAEELDKFYE